MSKRPPKPGKNVHDQCRGCGSMFEPHTDRTETCTVCTRYTSLVRNAAKPRRHSDAPGVDMNIREFAAWFAATPRRCDYCDVPELLVEQLGLRTQVDQQLTRLGIDRIDSATSYHIGNIVLCCFACNKAKSNTFTTEEMTLIGFAVADVWGKRLSGAGIEWIRSETSQAV